jgi:hypothetical protein
VPWVNETRQARSLRSCEPLKSYPRIETDAKVISARLHGQRPGHTRLRAAPAGDMALAAARPGVRRNCRALKARKTAHQPSVRVERRGADVRDTEDGRQRPRGLRIWHLPQEPSPQRESAEKSGWISSRRPRAILQARKYLALPIYSHVLSHVADARSADHLENRAHQGGRG